MRQSVASEQQEITAQTYDAITDLRQSFMRARKENEKSLKGAQSELVQLLKQGDQVIKSPWASFQFGTGYINNDWGTTYRGRGGKFLEYFRRNNDLTKYVFDKDKHLYGATNLNIPRNQEPDALTINPANVHKPYTPAEVTKLDAMTLPTAPTFDPSVTVPSARYYGTTRNDLDRRTFTTRGVTPTTADATANTNRSISYNNRSNIVASSASTFDLNAGSWKNTNNTTNTPDGFNGQTWNPGTAYQVSTTPTQYTGGVISDLSGDFFMRSTGVHSESYTETNGTTHTDNNVVRSYWYKYRTDGNGNWYDNLAGYNNVRVNNQELIFISGGNHDTGWAGNDLTFQGGTYGTEHAITPSGSQSSVLVNTDAKIWRSNFGVGSTSSDTNNYGATKSAGIYVNNGKTVTIEGGTRYYRDVRTEYTDGTYDAGGGLASDGNPTSSKTISGYRVLSQPIRRDGTTFYVNGIDNNGIYSAGGNVTVNGNTTGGVTFNLSTNNNNTSYYYDTNSRNNNGIFMNGGTATIKYATFNINSSGTGILMDGNSTGTVTGGTFNVNSGDGIYISPNSTISDVNDVDFNVAGDSDNGIYAASGSTLTQVRGTSHFNITGKNSNGILKDTTNNTTVSNSTFDVNGAGSTGITYNAHSNNEVITGSTFNVNGGNKTTAGVHMINAEKITVNPNTDFYVNGSGIGIEIVNNGTSNKEIEFDGNPLNPPVKWTNMTLGGTGSNVGINIMEGQMNSGTATREIKLHPGNSDKYGLDMTIVSDNNVGYFNRGYADKLTILSGNDPINTNSSSGYGRVKIGKIDPSAVGYNNNVIFANTAYAKAGEVNFKQIEIDGNTNTIAYFAPGNGGYFAGSASNPTNNANVGFFGGDLSVQGIIGRNNLDNDLSTYDSKGNIGVYVASGQRNGINTHDQIGEIPGTSLDDLNVKNLNIGVGPNAEDTTLVYAINGSAVKVANNTTTTNGNILGNTISDGEFNYAASGATQGMNYWGYTTPYSHISKGTVIAYSEGIFDNSQHKFGSNFNAGFDTNAPTKITINSPVDMVSKQGTAYRTSKGGQVVANKATRAGGYQSIIAYSQDDATRTQLTNGVTYKSMKGTENSIGSIIQINSGITAADNMLFSATNSQNIGTTAVPYGPASGRNPIDFEKAYGNIGAYAVGGGDVLIKGTKANESTKESPDTSVADAGGKSLIYGMAAYASGNGRPVVGNDNGSVVIFDSDDGAAATVVTGTNGALFATDRGYIEFAGEIVHQNNIGASVATGTAAEGATIGAGQTRGGRGTVTGVTNDHKDVPVFYVKRISDTDNAGITFNNATKIDMYDGYFLTGNEYQHRTGSINTYWNNSYSDYYKDKLRTAANGTAWDRARYRGMSEVTLNLVKGGEIDLGLINQAENTLKWDNDKDKTSANGYLGSIAKYAGEMANIVNKAGTNKASTSTATKFGSSIINSTLEVSDPNIELENYALSNPVSGVKSEKADGGTNVNDTAVDPFNNIKMESTKVNIKNNVKIYGDIGTLNGKSLLAGQGLNMANSLYRWDKLNDDNSAWVKTDNTQSGYTNEGTVSVWGGTKTDSITGINVVYGTIENKGSSAKVVVDHGFGIAGTDDSILKNNEGKIIVTGKYDPNGQDANIANTSLTNSKVARTTVETAPTGKNYGIVGISTNNATENALNGGYRYGNNKVNIENKDGIVEVDGELAVGIYAENVNQSGAVTRTDEYAQKSNVNVLYDNQNSSSQYDAIRVNYGAGVGGTQTTQENKNLHGVGIALVEKNKDTNAANRGGIITLNTKNSGVGQTADILTHQNGIGIYGESAEIKFATDSTGLTVDTGSDGAGIWVTDDSTISSRADRLGTPKTLNYNYKGYNDKKGFGMIFGSTDPNNRYGGTTAENYLDIKFNNNGATNLTLATEKAQTSPGTIAVNQGTTRGIAGILVNTDTTDFVKNYGDIKEDKSKTNVRAYGAVVNRGHFENHGNIELSDSLNEDASNVEKNDLKKVNAGIIANYHDKDARENTWIVNHGDIKVGTKSSKNVGGFGIYGYNIENYGKDDGTQSTITINKNSYGIYSGDGNVKIQKTKLLVGNDTVLGSPTTTRTTAPATDILKGRETDAAYGVYIGDNSLLSGKNRDVEVSADMDIDRFSYGIVLQNNANADLPGSGATTNVKIGDGLYTLDSKGKVASLTPTSSPTIVLGSNQNAGGQVKSTAPSNPKNEKDPLEQGNAVYYYSADKNSKASSYANVTMNGDYNIAYYTKGSVDNFGTIDLRSQNDLTAGNPDHGYGNLGIVSLNADKPSTNYGTITTGMSDTVNMMYSAGMAAGINIYDKKGQFLRTEDEGYVVNRGKIVVAEEQGIGMFATGSRSKAINYGDIELTKPQSIGMYLDHGATGENYGTITGDASNLKGVVAINGGYIKNYGKIEVKGTGSEGIITDNIDVKTNNTDGSGDLYGGTESSIKYVTSGNPKTTGVGTTITMPGIVPLTKITVDGVDTPIFNVETDAANPGDVANNITINSSIQTGGTRIIDLKAIDEWGNPVWPQRDKPQLSEITSIGMYVDTSGVRYTNPIDGLQNLSKLGEVNLYFGPEATLYTNSKAIRIGDTVDSTGTVIKSNILKPFNDALTNLPGGAVVNPLSASLTWQVAAKLDSNNQLSEIYMSKVPYHSFAYDNDKSLVNFTNNLDNIYEIAKPQSAEKVIFNKLNSLGNGEGHILAQAFDQMRGHIYGGVQQRIKSTSDILTGEMNGLRSDRNVSKDSNKFKAFGQRNEFKTDTAGMPDWYSNAGGFAFVHEDETVRLGQSSGWSAGVVNNYFTFKDLSKSYENQAMAKVGVFKTIPLDANGTFVLSLGGDGFFGRNDMKRRFWVVDQEFRAKASYYSYGAGLNAGLEKAFVINDGFSIVPNVGIRAEYGRFSSIHENGDMALNVKSDDYVSVKPSAGIDFRYSQEVFKNSNLTASLGFAYENEIGKLYDVENEARIVGAWTDYFGIRGDKEDKRGNFKSDLKLGLDNGRFGFNVNTGYDSKGHNFRAGLGLKVLY